MPNLIHEEGRVLYGHLLDDLCEDSDVLRRMALRWVGVQSELKAQNMSPRDIKAHNFITTLVFHLSEANKASFEANKVIDPNSDES